MSQQVGRGVWLSILAPFVFLLISCSPSASSTPTPSPSPITLDYFATDTPAPPPEAEDKEPESSPEPEATATPISYAIAEGDTLLGIAERHGISLDELLIANPEVDARFLSIGESILIPLGGSAISENIEEVELPDLGQGPVRCLASAVAELWCFVQIRNNTPSAIESPVAEVQLLDAEGQLVAQASAFGLIRKLDSGLSMPLVAFWASAPAGWQQAQATLSRAFRLDESSARYMPAQVESLTVEIAANGLSAQLTGEIVSAELAEASEIQLLAIAYDGEGLALGVRRLALQANQSQFDFEVYSLAGPIVSVDVLLEARR